MVVPKCNCGGSMLATSSKRRNGFTQQYRTCDNCGRRSSTKRYRGLDENILRDLVLSGTTPTIQNGCRVYLVAIGADGAILESVEISNPDQEVD